MYRTLIDLVAKKEVLGTPTLIIVASYDFVLHVRDNGFSLEKAQ